jgi:hypothetical protein
MKPSRSALVWLLGATAALSLAVAACTPGSPAPSPSTVGGVATLDQGPNWTPADRAAFYTQDQGARLVNLAWLRALQHPDGQPFLADGLTRYGYLANPPNALPVGFTTAGGGGDAVLGMTCAACHTRQITVGAVSYRVDGGPAFADFQRFLTDLDTAFAAALATDAAFIPFAAAALGHPATQPESAALHDQVAAWYGPFHTLMSRALPTTPWGPARLDAVGMIFNRVTGLDIGATPDRVIAANIRRADAPVRYPFLWNSAIQDRSQWPGFAENGNDVLALARNVGEVYGVFADFRPKRDWLHLIGYDYLDHNSVNFDGLARLNTLVKQLGPPKYPFPYDTALAAQGAKVFSRSPGQGGCASCHGIQPGAFRLLAPPTWKTPILDVNTDTREYDIVNWTADTGVLNGAGILDLVPKLHATDQSISVLKVAVVGSILQHAFPLPLLDPNLGRASQLAAAPAIAPHAAQLGDTYDTGPKPVAAYEARVLQGIWAAAPYLHDGAVPTLADLLKPAAQRPPSFAIGPAYDIDKLGLSVTQQPGAAVLHTTGCDTLNSGASHCGHEYGTTLPDPDKRALLEYLKTL